MWLNSQFSADLITFTEEILNGRFHFLCSVRITFYAGIWRKGSSGVLVNHDSRLGVRYSGSRNFKYLI